MSSRAPKGKQSAPKAPGMDSDPEMSGDEFVDDGDVDEDSEEQVKEIARTIMEHAPPRLVALLHPMNAAALYSEAQTVLEEDAEADEAPDRFPGINCCAVCARTVDKNKKPVECPDCKRIEYCSAKHASKDSEVHARVCPALDLVNQHEDEKNPDNLPPADLLKLIDRLWAERPSSHKEAKDAWTWDRTLFTRPTLTKLGVGADSLLGRSLTARLSYPLSLAYALYQVWHIISERVNQPSSTGKRQRSSGSSAGSLSLVVHIVGANEQECTSKTLWRELWHALTAYSSLQPEMTSLDIVFIGPEIPVSSHNASAAIEGLASVRLHYFSGLYEDFVRSSPSSSSSSAFGALPPAVLQAHAICCFQPGFTCPDYTWAPSIDAMRQQDAVLIVTTNTPDEAAMELMLLESWQAADSTHSEQEEEEGAFELTLPPVLCPLMSLQPQQSGTVANDLYYKNAVVTVLIPRPSSLAEPPSKAAKPSKGSKGSKDTKKANGKEEKGAKTAKSAHPKSKRK